MTMAITSEKQIQNQIIKLFESYKKAGIPIFWEKRQAGGYLYRKGLPDIYCVIYGIHFEIEVKSPNGKLSAMQEKFRDFCKQNEIDWICADSIDSIKNYFRENSFIF